MKHDLSLHRAHTDSLPAHAVMANAAPMLTYDADQNRSTDAAHRVRTHMGLVRKIAWHVHARVANSIEIEDLIQIGLVALVEASRSYEDRGHAFATYASMRIRGSMIDALRRSASIARSAMAHKKAIAACRATLEQQFGRSASDAEMAVAMGLTPAAYGAMIDAAADVRQESMDAVYSDHSMWFADSEERADDAIERAQLHAQLAGAIADLPEREAMVLQLYFVEEMNLDEIGETLGVGAARVCQIKKAALDRVRGMMAEA